MNMRAAIAALLTLSPMAAVAADLLEFKNPISSELRVEAILCKSPESLFLLYEGSTLAMKGGGQNAFQSYFQASSTALEKAGECVLEKEPQKVKVTAMATLTNPLKMPAGGKVYGRFNMKGLNRDVYAMSEDLPGLTAYINKAVNTADK
ncbi:hypothetical protein [Pseudomonas sp. P179]|uniref:hypothetical protein n=1 Tax=Pseudomonas sp. P179 TaxID=1125698 RepID=UPI0004F34FE2|nr:hypothetical protein [Pseudomonas sp. P179]